MFTLLLVDDEPEVLSALKRTFHSAEYQIHTARSGSEALGILRGKSIDAALVDLKMPGMDGLELLKTIRREYPQVRTIMLTGHGGVQEAVAAIQLGAVDFLEKPASTDTLRARVGHLYNTWQLEQENQALKARLAAYSCVEQFVGETGVVRRLKELIARIGPTDVSCLIQGETGTGKELVARGLHALSSRANKPFVPVDCAAISETVIESELFGHAKGAFTGAHTSTLGLIRSADGGTLFLDEVGELSPMIQAKLLRTTQTQEVRPVGSAKSHLVDVRLLAATNRDLAFEVSQGRFREDLYYRLNVFQIPVPPLRERKDDIALLCNHFIQRFQGETPSVSGVSQETLKLLEAHEWPGNVRELENVIRRALVVGRQELLQTEDLPPSLLHSEGQTHFETALSEGDSMSAYEMAAIRNALRKSGGNRKKTSEILGIGEATLYRKMKKYLIPA